MARKKVTPAPRPQSPGMMARILPPLGFILAFSLLAAFCHTISHGAVLSPAQRYEAAKEDMERLRRDGTRGMQRAPWEEMAAVFRDIHQDAATWPNRPAALFKAAECYEELSRRSFALADARKAAGTFEDVARRHGSSCLADDALLRAARIRAGRLKDSRGALTLLDTLCRDYPNGDMAAEARRLRQELAPGKDAVQPSGPPARQISDAPPAEDARQALQRYEEAKKTMELLRADKRRSCWREPWENLRGDFLQVYQSRPGATISAAALFRAGVSARALADCSHLAADYRTARTLLLRVPEEFPGSALADDALLLAAQISAGELKDRAGAVRLLARLEKEYPRGDMRPQAVALRRQLAPDAAAGVLPADASDGRGTAVPAGNLVAGQPGLSVQRVFLDAGHGGRDPGTIHNDVVERNITLDIALRLGRLLEDNGLEVIYSRRKDVAVSLRDRTGKANRAGADLFVSIHVNAHEDRGINGFETYYLDISRDPRAVRVASQENARTDRNLGEVQKVLSDSMLTARQYESRRLAGDIQKQSLARLKRRGYAVRDNGTRAAPFIVLLGARMPCVLVEVGYCSNPHEARYLLDARYRMILAEGLAEGILSYRDRVRQNRTAQNSLTPPASGAM